MTPGRRVQCEELTKGKGRDDRGPRNRSSWSSASSSSIRRARLIRPSSSARRFDAGLAWVHYPVGCGGRGADPKQHRVVQEALDDAGAPSSFALNPIGIGMVGPTIAQHGTATQRARYLRPLFTAEEIWCQLFSEPGAGSDLASLANASRVRRRRVGCQRSEGVDLTRPQGALRTSAGAHRRRRAEEPWPDDVPRRHARARVSTHDPCAR